MFAFILCMVPLYAHRSEDNSQEFVPSFYQGPNSDHLAWQKVPSLAEPSHWHWIRYFKGNKLRQTNICSFLILLSSKTEIYLSLWTYQVELKKKIVCECICIRQGDIFVMVHKWWSEDSLWESILSFYHVDYRDKI